MNRKATKDDIKNLQKQIDIMQDQNMRQANVITELAKFVQSMVHDRAEFMEKMSEALDVK